MDFEFWITYNKITNISEQNIVNICQNTTNEIIFLKLKDNSLLFRVHMKTNIISENNRKLQRKKALEKLKKWFLNAFRGVLEIESSNLNYK